MLMEGKTIRERNRGESRAPAGHGWQDPGQWQCNHRTLHGVWQLLPAMATTTTELKGPAQTPNLHYNQTVPASLVLSVVKQRQWSQLLGSRSWGKR